MPGPDSLPLAWYAWLGLFLLGYLFGSVPFGLLITRVSGLGDIRAIGSGNIGATNVLRTGRKGLAALTLLCDMLKGTAAVLIMYAWWGRDLSILAGVGAFLGHLFPVWLGFKGGKGVATYIGVLLGLAWPAALSFAAIWIAVAAVTRYSSLAALIAAAATPFILWFAGDRQEAQVFLVLTVLIFIMHHANITRLIRGREGKIGESAKSVE